MPLVVLATVAPDIALAQSEVASQGLSTPLDVLDIAKLAIVASMALVAIVTAMLYVRTRRQLKTQLAYQQGLNTDLLAKIDEVEVLLNTDDQRLIVWSGEASVPQQFGSLPKAANAPVGHGEFLAFGNWLVTEHARMLRDAIDTLRRDGRLFQETVETRAGGFLEVSGRPSGSRSLVRFRDLTAERTEFAALSCRHDDLSHRFDAMKSALDAAPTPAWLKSSGGRMLWVNSLYREAVDADTDTSLIDLPGDLLETSERSRLSAQRDPSGLAQCTLSVVFAGDRRTFDVVEVVTSHGTAGMAVDVTEVVRAQAALKQATDFHASTLDQLATAVAIFGADEHLQFYNNAYQKLWNLDTAFLDGHPDDASILDRLRSERRLPGQADFRVWKSDMLEIYRTVDPQEHWWHLPDGKTIRVLANPHPQGGVTYVYENVTEQLSLESKYNALIRVQGETLDYLAEGVAVFGPDGKLRLYNPPFRDMWQIPEADLADRPHISDIVSWCSRLFPGDWLWSEVTAAVTGLVETRESAQARIERQDMAVIDVSTVPMPDGSTLVTFVDISDTVKVERALTEKNAALQAADDLKNAFIQNVSYELRSPLTNIIGFAQLLAEPSIGHLNEKQSEYTGYILSSSSALLTIINDILDLATIDAGTMELNLSQVDLHETINAAIEALQDRLAEARITVDVSVPDDVGTLIADQRRLRQILYNLVSNAISYSDDGGRIRIDCERGAGFIELRIEDDGCGIPEDLIQSVFERFEGRSSGGRRRGPGLGLSIVKSFVELHNGAVQVDSRQAEGTRVICRFPIEPDSPLALH